MSDPDDGWDPTDRYPMHPAHPGWETERDPTVERLRGVLPWLFVALGAAVGVALVWRLLTA